MPQATSALTRKMKGPEKRLSLYIPIKVSYTSDPEKVEKILLEETKRAVGEISGLLAAPEPVVRFIPGFGDYSLL